MSQEKATIELTPTWVGVMPLLIAALTTGTQGGRDAAAAELNRLAMQADRVQTALDAIDGYDTMLNRSERAPEGEDYNAVLRILGVR